MRAGKPVWACSPGGHPPAVAESGVPVELPSSSPRGPLNALGSRVALGLVVISLASSTLEPEHDRGSRLVLGPAEANAGEGGGDPLGQQVSSQAPASWKTRQVRWGMATVGGGGTWGRVTQSGPLHQGGRGRGCVHPAGPAPARHLAWRGCL